MASLNRVSLIGNLGADPEIRTLTSGKRVANLRVACSETWKDRDSGEKKERTEWITCTVWGDGLVGVLEKYARKGSRLLVEGKFQTRKWKHNDGSDRFSTEVVVQGFGCQIMLLDKREGGSGQADGGQSSGGGSRHSRDDDAGYSREEFSADLDDEIPF